MEEAAAGPAGVALVDEALPHIAHGPAPDGSPSDGSASDGSATGEDGPDGAADDTDGPEGKAV